MSISSKASRFAHLVMGGVRPSAAKSAEDEEKDKKAKAKAAKAEQDEKEKDEAAKAEKDDEKKDDESDEEHEARKAKKAKAKGSKAKAEEDEEDADDDMRAKSEADDGEEEMRGKSAIVAARARENDRCAAIFADAAAAGNLPLAATLAFNTRMPRAEAIDVLRSTPVSLPAAAEAPRRTLAQRHAADPKVEVVLEDENASSAGDDSPQARAAACFTAAEKARGTVK